MRWGFTYTDLWGITTDQSKLSQACTQTCAFMIEAPLPCNCRGHQVFSAFCKVPSVPSGWHLVALHWYYLEWECSWTIWSLLLCICMHSYQSPHFRDHLVMTGPTQCLSTYLHILLLLLLSLLQAVILCMFNEWGNMNVNVKKNQILTRKQINE